jgi:hypothetical protein
MENPHDANISHPCNRLWRPIGLWDVEAPIFPRHSAHRWRWDFNLTCRPPFDSWYSFLLEAESIFRTIGKPNRGIPACSRYKRETKNSWNKFKN